MVFKSSHIKVILACLTTLEDATHVSRQQESLTPGTHLLASCAGIQTIPHQHASGSDATKTKETAFAFGAKQMNNIIVAV